jgi:16S rRNA (uracil1498-N3)-methyltransferase
MLRLFVESDLEAGALLEASAEHAHYLGVVMRRGVGEPLCLFNGRDGEWSGRVEAIQRGKARFLVEALRRPQADEGALTLMFALLKRDTTDLVVQKATELGVSDLRPVITERTNAARTNETRLRAIAIEAAEQSERLTVPVIHAPMPLAEALGVWPVDWPLFCAMERADVAPLRSAAGPAGLLIGPEGGFGPRDHALLERAAFVRAVGLGPRILRAETAAIVGLALLQAA